MRIRIACGLDSRSWSGFWKNDRSAVRAVRTIQYNNSLFCLLFIIYNILYNICNLLFIRLAVITHIWIAIRHPVTIISWGAFVPLAVKWPLDTRCVSRITVKALVTSNIIQSVCLVGKGRLKERCGLKPRTNFFSVIKSAKTVRIIFGCGLDLRIYGVCRLCTYIAYFNILNFKKILYLEIFM